MRLVDSAGPRARSHTHSLSELDRNVQAAGLLRERRLTAGFGPFTFLKQKLLPGSKGARLHYFLQNRADHARQPMFRKSGYALIVSAVKPCTFRTESPP